MLLQLIGELAEYEKLSSDVIATEESLRRTMFGSRRFAEAFLAFHAGFPAGFAVYFFAYSTFRAKPVLYLEDLFVREPMRGKGIGRRLLAELIETAERENCGRIAWSVLDWNQPAIRFYERIGARAQSQWLRYELSEHDFPGAAGELKKFANQGSP